MRTEVKILLFTAFVLSTFSSFGQEKKDSFSSYLKNKVDLNGYLKYLHTSSYTSVRDINSSNWLHNRINLHYYPARPLEVAVEVRNRVFYGEQLRFSPLVGQGLGNDRGLVDMSFLPVNEPSIVVHSKIDRAYMQWRADKFDLTLGRQRINWGVNLVWNPNDLFNTYNFVNFDYEERPGSDAIRFQYYTGDLSSAEIAIRPANNDSDWVAAGLYKFHLGSYDIQALGGLYHQDLAMGAGWAGNIKKAGLKGEATYFHPKTNFEDTSGVLNASVSLDYSFASGLYLNGSALYNSNGVTDVSGLSLTDAFSGTLSAKHLMPTQWSGFGQVSGTFSPILSGSMAAIYSPGVNLLFLMPSVTYSISSEWDLMLLGQSYFLEMPAGELENISNLLFMRLKWSY